MFKFICNQITPLIIFVENLFETNVGLFDMGLTGRSYVELDS